jgi:hypothetical protein
MINIYQHCEHIIFKGMDDVDKRSKPNQSSLKLALEHFEVVLKQFIRNFLV